MESVTANLNGKIRREKRNGRDYLVVPMRLLREGVIPGSDGALFYPGVQIENSAPAWNDIPIVVYHPMKDGKPVSGRSPAVLDERKIGRVYNSLGKDGDLDAEGWVDVETARRVDAPLLGKLERAEKIQLSTGLSLAKDEVPPGTVHNGVPYKATTRDYVPDHVAILPTGQAACGLIAGCGIFVNSLPTLQDGDAWEAVKIDGEEGYKIKGPTADAMLKDIADAVANDEAAPYGYCPQCGAKGLIRERRMDGNTRCENGHVYPSKDAVTNKPEPKPTANAGKKSVWRRFVDYVGNGATAAVVAPRDFLTRILGYSEAEAEKITANAKISHDDLRSQLCHLIAERFGPGEYSLTGERPYVVDIYDKYLVYEAKEKLWRLGYSTDQRTGTVSLAEGDPQEVARQVDYKPVTNESPVPIPSPTTTNGGDVDKTQTIAWLVANCDCWKNKAEELATFPDAAIASLKANAEATQKAQAVANAATKPVEVGDQLLTFNSATSQWEAKPKAAPAPAPVPVAAPVTNANRLTAEEQEDLAYAREERMRRKQEMIGRLVANISDDTLRQQNAAFYATLNEKQLAPLVAALPAPVEPAQPQYTANWLGAAPYAPAAAVKEEPLPDAVWNWKR